MNRKFLAGLLGVCFVLTIALPSFAFVKEGDQIGKTKIKKVLVNNQSADKLIMHKECAACIKNNLPQGDPHLKCKEGGSCMEGGTCAGKRSGKCVCEVTRTFITND